MRVLVVDVGGTNVKFLATGQSTPGKFPSGRTLTPQRMVAQVKQKTVDWNYDVVSLGYPGLVRRGRIAAEPRNLGKGWVGFNFFRAFRCPVKVMNDAAMQALGSYNGGRLLFLGLGTGLGSTLVVDGNVIALELAHFPYKRGTLEDYLGLRGLKRLGKKKWQRQVAVAVAQLIDALFPDDVVLGGGNAKKLKTLPPGSRAGNNALAFLGGYRMWKKGFHVEADFAAGPRLVSTRRGERAEARQLRRA
jgi:predicted NBD/HSP70 family sugar kinase